MMNDKKIDFIPLDKLFYVKTHALTSNDMLFQNALNELGFEDKFNYQMSFSKEKENIHIFLSRIENLKQKNACYPEAFIFKCLYKEQWINEKNFALLIFRDNLSYIYFYKDGVFHTFKILHSFGLKNLKNTADKEIIFNNIIKDSHLMEILNLYQSAIFISFQDHYDFNNFLKTKLYIPIIKLENLLQNDSFDDLLKKSSKYLDQDENFIKKPPVKNSFAFSIFLNFFISFILSFAFLFILYFTQEQNKKQNFYNNDHNLTAYKTLTQQIIQNFPLDDEHFVILYKLIELLNQKQIFLKKINLSKNITLDFDSMKDFIKAKEIFSTHHLFFIEKENKNSLILGFKNVKN